LTLRRGWDTPVRGHHDRTRRKPSGSSGKAALLNIGEDGAGSNPASVNNRRGRDMRLYDEYIKRLIAVNDEDKTELDETNKLGFSPTMMEKVHPTLFADFV